MIQAYGWINPTAIKKTGTEQIKSNYENNQQDALYSLIYYSKSALHVSGDVLLPAPAGSNLGEHYQIL